MPRKSDKKFFLYLFCNENYGYQYLKKTIGICKRFPEIELIVVLSSKNFSLSGKNSLIINILKITYFRKLLLQVNSRCANLAKVNNIGFQFVENINSNSFQRNIQAPAIGIIAGFNQIFRKTLLSKFATVVNFHPSLLPSYKGPIPSYWVLKNKEKYTGVTVHKVTENIDEGLIIYNKSLRIKKYDTPEILDYKLSKIGSEILENKFLKIINNNRKKN